MSRPRRFGHDYIYGLDHFERFPEQYRRLEHRFKLADVDWNEFCGYCHRPHTLVEMFRDSQRGQDLRDKGVTVTRALARGVGAHAYVMAYLAERPPDVQSQIDRLNTAVIDMTRQWPITRFRAQLVEPHRGKVFTYNADEWWSLIALRHSDHHLTCRAARSSRERLANPEWVTRAAERHAGLWSPSQPALWEVQ